jgi:pimeloyl-ACP methyl ester carboxylesterase
MTVMIFQHGLTGDENQIAEVFPPGSLGRLTLECRGHGKNVTQDNGAFSIPAFADDVLKFADDNGADQFVIGGISMGAAIASRIAVTAPTRVKALIMVRPAWLWDDAPYNMQIFVEAARHLREGTLASFDASASAKLLSEPGPDNLNSIRGLFGRPHGHILARLISSIARDGPKISRQQLAALTIPTLVIGNSRDYVHPLTYARQLADLIPNSRYAEVFAKADNKQRHIGELQHHISTFLTGKT